MSFPLSLAVSAFDLFLSVVCDGSFLTNGAVVTMVVRRLSLVAIRDVVESEERLLVQAKRVALTLRVWFGTLGVEVSILVNQLILISLVPASQIFVVNFMISFVSRG